MTQVVKALDVQVRIAGGSWMPVKNAVVREIRCADSARSNEATSRLVCALTSRQTWARASSFA